MTSFPSPQPGRALKWNADGSDLTNSAYDPDLVAQTTADLAKGAAGSAKQAADAAYDATLKAGSVAGYADQAQSAADAAALSAQSAGASRDQAAVSASQAVSAETAAVAARDAAVAAKDLAVAAESSAEAARNAAVTAKDQSLTAQSAAEAARDAALAAKTGAEAAQGGAIAARDMAVSAETAALAARAGAETARDAAVAAQGQCVSISDTLLATTGSQGIVTLDETNLALSMLLQQATGALSVLHLANAASDRFVDQTGIASLGGGTVTGGYLCNPGGPVQYTPTGSVFSNMANSAAGFDGNANKTVAASPNYGYPDGYLGKAFATPQAITRVIVSGTNDMGYDGGSLSPYTVTINVYGKNGAPSSPTDGTLLGTSGTFTDNNTTNAKTITCPGSSWTHVWAALTTTNTTNVAQVQYFTTATPSNIATVSAAYATASAPAAISLVAQWKDVSGTAVLNTDLVLRVSRDGGTSWTAVTMTDLGAAPVAGARILRGTADVSGQPSGTALKWKVETANGKEQQVHGIFMQWR